MTNDEHLTQIEALKSQQISKAFKNEQILCYAWDMKKNGRADITIATNVKRLYAIAKHCQLNDPEQVKGYIAEMKCTNRTKSNLVQTYHNFLEFLGLKWKKPTYKAESRIPYIPTEQEIDQLINSAHAHKTAAYLQLLKETGARLGEALKIKWTDLNEERKTI
jgi:integrase